MTDPAKSAEFLKWQNSLSPFSISKELFIIKEPVKPSLTIAAEVVSKADLMKKLLEDFAKCKSCALGSTRKTLVFGEGDINAKLMFIGEGPGEDEDISGRPFVGRAGQLLTKIIENGLKLPRESVYIANIVKCRPPGNRDPLPEEAQACIGILKKQIEIVNPKAIVLLGKVAIRFLLGVETTIKAARETDYSYDGVKVFATYHPSALLRNEGFKKPTWEDMKKVMSYLGL